MHFETRAQAQAFLDAQGFTPALKRRHRVVLDRYFFSGELGVSSLLDRHIELTLASLSQ